MTDDFINLRLTESNLDTYFIRVSILKALENNLINFEGRLLDIGCGKMPYKQFILNNSEVKEYIGLDIETALVYDEAVNPDFRWDGIKMPFIDNSFSCAMGTELLEHCFEPEITLKEIHRVLKPGGVFFFTVPFLWNLHEVPYDAYRFTPFSLEHHLTKSGFNSIEIYSYGEWHSSLALMIGLWLRRSKLHYFYRKIFSFFLKPIIKILIKKESHKFGNKDFSEGIMIPGLFGICKK